MSSLGQVVSFRNYIFFFFYSENIYNIIISIFFLNYFFCLKQSEYIFKFKKNGNVFFNYFKLLFLHKFNFFSLIKLSREFRDKNFEIIIINIV